MQNYFIDQYNKFTKATSTYMLTEKQCIILFNIIITFSAIAYVQLYMKKFKGKLFIYFILILIIATTTLIKLNNVEVEELSNYELFENMPSPGISEINDNFTNPVIEYHVKTAYNPLNTPSSKFTYFISGGNTKWEQHITNLDFILSRGIRGLCFNVVYVNNKPYITNGEYNNVNKYKTNTKNNYDFYTIMNYLKNHAIQSSAKVNVPNYNDPLFIILRIHSPNTENNYGIIGSTLKNIFDVPSSGGGAPYIPKDGNGNYSKLTENTLLNSLKNKVLIMLDVVGVGSLENNSTLNKISFSKIHMYNQQNIQNTLAISSNSSSNITLPPRLAIPLHDGLQNKKDCYLTLENYFFYNIQFIAINYQLEDDSEQACSFKYESKFKSEGHAFILMT